MAAETGATAGWAGFNVHLAAGMLREAAVDDDADRRRGHPVRQARLHRHGASASRPASCSASRRGTRRSSSACARSRCRWPAAIPSCSRPPRSAPATHRLIGECLREAGLPTGVVNVITNAPEDAPARGRGADRPSRPCAASTSPARRASAASSRETAAKHLKPVLLELGGKAPLLVLDDADLDEAVNAAAFGAFMNQGQICMSTERIIVDEKVADAFVDKLADQGRSAAGRRSAQGQCRARLADRRRGRRPDAGPDRRRDRQGRAACVAGGKANGTLMSATVVDHVTPTMRIYGEESFGPVVCIIRVNGDDEAVRVANDTEYGLSAAVFSRDIARALDSGQAHRVRHLPHQRADRARRGADAVRRHQGVRLRPLRRQGGDRRVHRTALDHDRDRPAALSDLTRLRGLAGFERYPLVINQRVRSKGLHYGGWLG